MPIGIVSRFLSSSLRFALAPVNAILAGGSATFGGLKLRQTAFAPSSTKFGLAPLTASSPLSHELPTINRLTPGRIGIFDLRGGSCSSKVSEGAPETFTSMKVRRHLFLQKKHRVFSLRCVS